MNEIKLIIFLVWIPQAIGQYLTWLYWVQTKEYRYDKFSVLLRSKSSIKKLDTSLIFIKLFLLGLTQFVFLIFLVFLFLDLKYLYLFLKKKFRKPIFTNRINNIVKLSFGLIVLDFLSSLVGLYRFETALLIAEILLMLSISIGVIWTKKYVKRALYEITEKAKKKLKISNPKVVGITGSYGKSSTKEFLYHLLKDSKRTAKTDKNQNNDFGVAMSINKNLKKDTEVFVAEMGAYKIGEINAITNYINPDISIVTGIEPQHLELFGNIENIKKAKYEIVDALAEGGVAILNIDSDPVKDLAIWAKDKKIKVITYRRQTAKSSKDEYLYSIIKSDPKGVSFKVIKGNSSHQLYAPVHGTHFIENLVAAVIAAVELKVSWTDIKKACRRIKLPEGTMRVTKSNGRSIIDDSYNSSPSGFKAALDYLNMFDAPKIVITSGIQELGSYSKITHEELGSLMNKTDLVILTNRDFENYIKKKLAKEKFIVSDDPRILNDVLKSFPKESTILLEGRLPSAVRKLFI